MIISVAEAIKESNKVDGVMGFVTYIEDNFRWYGCRGFGKIYNDFYTWLRTKPQSAKRLDFPWDYWVFSHEEDELLFNELYVSVYGIIDVTDDADAH
jgi:hypothetical protein